MKKLYFVIILCLVSFKVHSQIQTFWTEDFNNGCTTFCNASAYVGTNGAWTVTDVTAPGSVANEWFVSCAENGEAVGSCGAGCGNNATLHVGNVPCNLCFVCPNGDCGAAYNAGPGFGGQSPKSDKIAVSPVIDASQHSNIIISFKYIERGQNTTDDATVEYSLDGTTWNLLGNTAKTTNSCGGGQGLWTTFTDTLPATCNNAATLNIGFHWINNADGVGSDPSFAVDDVQLSTDITGLQNLYNDQSFVVSYNSASNEIKLIFKNNFNDLFFKILDITGRKKFGKKIMNTHSMPEFVYNTSALSRGIYFVSITTGDSVVTKKLFIQ